MKETTKHPMPGTGENNGKDLPVVTDEVKGMRGLTLTEVEELRKRFGPNVMTIRSRHDLLKSLIGVIKEPMFLILAGACGLYFILGEPEQGVLMAVAMAFVTAVSIYQEMKSSRALASLNKYTEPKVRVLREGKDVTIETEELVPGDIVMLEEGRRVPADATIIQANDLSVDESIVTGESLPVEKSEAAPANELLQGALINSGQCYARVTQTGGRATLGRLGLSIEAPVPPPTRLQKEVNVFVKAMAIFGVIAFLLIFYINYRHGTAVLTSLLLGLTIAMSAIPEEIPVAFSSFLALGAYRMAEAGIIVRQPRTIENLGAMNVICLDKTGTITENRMKVTYLYDAVSGMEGDPGEEPGLMGSEVLWYARLASEREPFDAMEKAIVEMWKGRGKGSGMGGFERMGDRAVAGMSGDDGIDGAGDGRIPGDMVHEYPLAGSPPMMTHVYEIGGRLIAAGKGAPERIVAVTGITGERLIRLREKVGELASKGYRVLGVCCCVGHEGPYPAEQDGFAWIFSGLVALYDPPREGARGVIGSWKEAGIRPMVLSGDYPGTVRNIAALVGMEDGGNCVTGTEVMEMTEDVLKATVRTEGIYARMFPEAKQRVIMALKEEGNIVAMTGDGVNDAPALSSAHIGIAMGGRGTEMAREAADMVISDDNLGRITEAVRQGRAIYENLRKAIRYMISIHIPIIGAASLPVLLGWRYPNIFSPIHVVFMELIMGPTCSLFFEREPVGREIMRPPAAEGRGKLYSHREVLLTVLQGAISLICLLMVYHYFMQGGHSLEYTRSMVFITLIVNNIFLTFASRSLTAPFYVTIRYRNGLAPVVLGLSVVFLVVILCIPLVRDLFGLAGVRPVHLLVAVSVGMVSVIWFEGYKIITYGDGKGRAKEGRLAEPLKNHDAK